MLQDEVFRTRFAPGLGLGCSGHLRTRSKAEVSGTPRVYRASAGDVPSRSPSWASRSWRLHGTSPGGKARLQRWQGPSSGQRKRWKKWNVHFLECIGNRAAIYWGPLCMTLAQLP